MYENAVIIKSKKAFILFYVVFAVFLFVSCQKSPTPESKKEVQVEQELKQPSIIEEERGRKSDRIIKTEEPPLVATKETGSEKPEQIKLKETVPFVTEVMSKEEQQIYLKEKGIPIITKENFKEPEILWDRMFDEPLHSIHQPITDLTEKGNSILITGKGQGYVDYIKIYFIDNKGNIHKKLDLGKIEESAYAVAKSGRGAAVCKGATKEGEFILTYYNEEGSELWNKKIELKDLRRTTISDNGETIAIEERNTEWSIEEWGVEGLNIVKVLFFDNTGKQTFEYQRFRNIDCGKFSADGRYYVGLFCWQEDFKAWGKLIYIDVRDGKVLWEKLFISNWWKWPEYFDQNSLAISERGSYVATVDMEPAEKAPPDNQKDYMEVVVFNKDGKEMMRVKGSHITTVREDGFLGAGNIKGRIDITRLKSTGLVGSPPYFIRPKIEDIWKTKKGEGRVGKIISYKFLSLDGEILWELPKELAGSYNRFTEDMKYIVVYNSIDKLHKKIIVYQLYIHLPEGGQER